MKGIYSLIFISLLNKKLLNQQKNHFTTFTYYTLNH